MVGNDINNLCFWYMTHGIRAIYFPLSYQGFEDYSEYAQMVHLDLRIETNRRNLNLYDNKNMINI